MKNKLSKYIQCLVKLKLLLAMLLLIPSIGFTQNSQTEINKQVWESFILAYSTQDVALFNSLHTDDVLRITSKGIQSGEEYKNANIAVFKGLKAMGQTMDIDFRFDQRLVKDNIAYEVGIYRLTVNGSSKFYGRFHVVLRKIDDTWKIAQDYDASQVLDQEVNQEDFDRGKTMQDFTNN